MINQCFDAATSGFLQAALQLLLRSAQALLRHDLGVCLLHNTSYLCVSWILMTPSNAFSNRPSFCPPRDRDLKQLRLAANKRT